MKLFLLTLLTALYAACIVGCTYNEHYYGEEKMLDEGVVVDEHYVVK